MTDRIEDFNRLSLKNKPLQDKINKVHKNHRIFEKGLGVIVCLDCNIRLCNMCYEPLRYSDDLRCLLCQ